MELLFEEATLFKRYIEGIAVLVDEAEFIIDEAGLSLKATDPSQISLIDFILPKTAFKTFEVKDQIKIGVDLNYLNQIISRAKPSDSLGLTVSTDNSKLNLSFIGSSKRTFSIPLLDLSSAELPLPKIDFDSEIVINSSALQDSFKDALLISTHITLSIEKDSFIVKANSSKGNLENVYANDAESIVSFKATNETTAMFPLDYLLSVTKAASTSTKVKLKLKTNAPIEISYEIGEGKFKYFLAPRIESD